ncbi:MAG: zinc metalloprotease [Salibacteraceae bacterium]
MEKTASMAEQSSSYDAALKDIEAMAEEFEAGLVAPAIRSAKEVVIPVVVHVLYDREENNIPDSQILSQIDALNRDFNWEQWDKFKIPAVWRDLGVASGFRFKLADVDPQGNWTKGITRKQVFETIIGGGDNYYSTSRGGVDPWPQAHYINIWVCEIGDNVLGFAYLPASDVPANDGIVMDPRAFGLGGTAQAPYDGGRTLVHEMGHYLGLRHLWGMEEGSCTNTDYMSDTPWQQEPNYRCSQFPSKSCASEKNGDMFMNFMDYADDTCALLFTKKQVEFMQLVLRTSRVTLIHSDAATAIKEGSASGYSLYPIPVSNELIVSASNDLMLGEFRIIDISGRIVNAGQLSQRNSIIDVSFLPNGSYILNTSAGNKRFIKISNGR